MCTAINIIKGDILYHKVDCIVNSACKSMRNDFGTVNKALFEIVDDDFKSTSLALAPLKMNNPIMVVANNMSFKNVIHVLVPDYKKDCDDFNRIKKCYYNVLNCAKDNCIHSISLPTLGMGGRGFPKEMVVKACFEVVQEWRKDNITYDLDITVVCYSEDNYLAYKQYQNENKKMSKTLSFFEYNDIKIVNDFLEYFIILPSKNWKFSSRITLLGGGNITELQQLKYTDKNVKVEINMQVCNKNNSLIIKSLMIDYTDSYENKFSYFSPKNKFYSSGNVLYNKLLQLKKERPRYKYYLLDKDMILKKGIKQFILDESSSGLLNFRRYKDKNEYVYKSEYLDGDIVLGYKSQLDADKDNYEETYLKIHIGDYLEIYANSIVDRELYTCITGKTYIKRLHEKDAVVRINNKSCIDVNHKLNEITAYIPVLITNLGLQQIPINAFYCKSCQRYYILENTYKNLKTRGLICCRVIDSKDLTSNSYSSWATESVIKQYGYNVSVTENLSEYKRHVILEFIIQNNILSKAQVVEHISWLIRANIDRPRYRDAVKKWTTDLNYLIENNPIIASNEIIVDTLWKK